MQGGCPSNKTEKHTMKKLISIHLPVAVALAFCFTACSENVTAPDTMCWDEEWTYANLVDYDSEALQSFIDANQCHSAYACAGIKMTVHRCVDNVEFK
jgi:hypothetical protein